MAIIPSTNSGGIIINLHLGGVVQINLGIAIIFAFTLLTAQLFRDIN